MPGIGVAENDPWVVRSEGVVVPAVGVVIGQDHGGRVPVRLLLKEVDQVDQSGLRIERIGVAGVTVLERLPS